jgi:diguanylate cyclase (GGDEF)-like protein
VIGIRTRRSIVFQLWARLSAITVSFTFLALALYAWIEIHDIIENEYREAQTGADATANAVARILRAGEQPSGQEIVIAQALGVKAIQILNADGTVVSAFGSLQGADRVDLEQDQAPEHRREVKIRGSDFSATEIGTLALLRGGNYGAAFLYPTSGLPSSVQIIIAYDDISGVAQTFLLRTVALTGAILVVAVIALWLLLTRFVAQPLREYSQVAMRIASGAPLRMPEAGNNELGQLGQAINSMAAILRHQATVDSLTGLYNLRHLSLCMDDYLAEARANNDPLSVLVCDLDNLKPVNDSYGHQVGDLLLKNVARHFLAWAGLDFTCWRIGGDEFAAVLPGLTPEEAMGRVSELEEAINASTISVAGGAIPVGVSMGLASFPADGTAGTALLNVADLRMYEAKSRKAKAPVTQVA